MSHLPKAVTDLIAISHHANNWQILSDQARGESLQNILNICPHHKDQIRRLIIDFPVAAMIDEVPVELRDNPIFKRALATDADAITLIVWLLKELERVGNEV